MHFRSSTAIKISGENLRNLGRSAQGSRRALAVRYVSGAAQDRFPVRAVREPDGVRASRGLKRCHGAPE